MDFTSSLILILTATFIEYAAGATTSAPSPDVTTAGEEYTTGEELTTGLVSTTIDYSDDTPWYFRLFFILPTLGVIFLIGGFLGFMGCRAFGQAHCPKYCPDDIPDPPPKKKKGDKSEDKKKKKKNKVEPKWIKDPPSWMEETDTTKVWIEQPPSWMDQPDPDNPQKPSWLDNPPDWMKEPDSEEEGEEIPEDSPDYIPPDENAPRAGHSWD